MWVLVHEDKAWQITSEDPTGLWGEDYVWVDIGDNPDGIQETWVAKNTKGVWKFNPYQPSMQVQTEANKAEHARLLSKASVAMTPLLVSLQLGDASDEETLLAQAWQQYYRDLKATNLLSENVVWPTPPEST